MESKSHYTVEVNGQAINKQARVVALIAPSGGGKSYIARKLIENSHSLQPVHTWTTRPRRQGEHNTRHDHNFVEPDKFQRRLKLGGFAICATIYENDYGLPLLNSCSGLDEQVPYLLIAKPCVVPGLREIYPQTRVIHLESTDCLDTMAKHMARRGQNPIDIKRRIDAYPEEVIQGRDLADKTVIFDGHPKSALSEVTEFIVSSL